MTKGKIQQRWKNVSSFFFILTIQVSKTDVSYQINEIIQKRKLTFDVENNLRLYSVCGKILEGTRYEGLRSWHQRFQLKHQLNRPKEVINTLDGFTNKILIFFSLILWKNEKLQDISEIARSEIPDISSIIFIEFILKHTIYNNRQHSSLNIYKTNKTKFYILGSFIFIKFFSFFFNI